MPGFGFPPVFAARGSLDTLSLTTVIDDACRCEELCCGEEKSEKETLEVHVELGSKMFW